MINILVTGLGVILAATSGRATSQEFETSIDPGGCILEHVLVQSGMEHHQYDGLSPNGEELIVAWLSGKERGTYIFNLNTGEREDLIGLNNGGSFLPDGRTIISAIRLEKTGRPDTDIVEYSRDTGEMKYMAPSDAWDWLPSYSSNGKVILFNSYRTGGSDVYTLDRDGGGLKRWTDFESYEAHAQFSPDDTRILFHRKVGDGNYDLFIIDVSTGEITQLTAEDSEDAYGSWGPNGEVIIFGSDRFQENAGATDLLLMTVTGEIIERLTNHPATDSYPFFSPDGKYIYFNSERGSQGVYRIALDENFECMKESD